MLSDIIKTAGPKVIISTGNVLNVNKKAGQKPTEELIDCLAVTLNEAVLHKDLNEIHRANDDLHEKINEHERNSIKVGAKIFLNNDSAEYLDEAVSSILRILNVDCLDNLILAYHPKSDGQVNNVQQEPKEAVLEWGGKSSSAVQNLKILWKKLEGFSKSKMTYQLGISDLDVDTLQDLYNNCNVHPTIAQINLSACCVVPPPLQEFCNGNDIQLLTHSDPEVILDEDALNNLGLKNYKPTWTVRYQVHVKCRGLLTAKGYIIGSRLIESKIPHNHLDMKHL